MCSISAILSAAVLLVGSPQASHSVGDSRSAAQLTLVNEDLRTYGGLLQAVAEQSTTPFVAPLPKGSGEPLPGQPEARSVDEVMRWLEGEAHAYQSWPDDRGRYWAAVPSLRDPGWLPPVVVLWDAVAERQGLALHSLLAALTHEQQALVATGQPIATSGLDARACEALAAVLGLDVADPLISAALRDSHSRLRVDLSPLLVLQSAPALPEPGAFAAVTFLRTFPVADMRPADDSARSPSPETTADAVRRYDAYTAQEAPEPPEAAAPEHVQAMSASVGVSDPLTTLGRLAEKLSAAMGIEVAVPPALAHMEFAITPRTWRAGDLLDALSAALRMCWRSRPDGLLLVPPGPGHPPRCLAAQTELAAGWRSLAFGLDFPGICEPVPIAALDDVQRQWIAQYMGPEGIRADAEGGDRVSAWLMADVGLELWALLEPVGEPAGPEAAVCRKIGEYSGNPSWFWNRMGGL